MYQPRRYLSKMRTTNYMAFTWEKAALKIWANGERPPSPPPSNLNPQVCQYPLDAPVDMACFGATSYGFTVVRLSDQVT